MRKKIIAAAAVQLAAALFLLLITPLWSWALEKYGRDHTLAATYVQGNYGWYEDADGEHFAICIDCEKSRVDGLEHPAPEYTQITKDEQLSCYMGSDSNAVYLHLSYCVKDMALSKKLAALYNDELEAFDGLEYIDLFYLRQKIEGAAYKVTVRVFGSKMKLLNVTVDGKDIEAFLAGALGDAL